MPERIGADGVACERAQRAGAPRGGVKDRGLRRVIDEHRDPAIEVPRRAVEPPVDGQADLGDLAVPERHALRGQAVREGRAARISLDGAEPITVDVHEQLPWAAGTADEAVHRQRVQHLVGHHRTRLGPVTRGWIRQQPVRQPVTGKAGGEGVMAGRLDLDRAVADRVEKRRAEIAEAAQQPRRERPGASPGLGDGER